MDRSDVIYLLHDTYTPDAIGERIPTTVARRVFCNVSSVTGTEWFSGGQNGIRPEYRVVMFRHDYEGETAVNIGGTLEGETVKDGTEYTVYRTYNRDLDELELYLERRTGS